MHLPLPTLLALMAGYTSGRLAVATAPGGPVAATSAGADSDASVIAALWIGRAKARPVYQDGRAACSIRHAASGAAAISLESSPPGPLSLRGEGEPEQ